MMYSANVSLTPASDYCAKTEMKHNLTSKTLEIDPDPFLSTIKTLE